MDLFSIGLNTKLFYRLGFPYCESCVFPVFDALKTDCPQISEEDIIIISSFPNEEYATEFNKNMKNQNLKVINIPDEDFCLDMNNFNGSYLFMMDSNLHHKNLFFTNKFNIFMLNYYLNFINQSM